MPEKKDPRVSPRSPVAQPPTPRIEAGGSPWSDGLVLEDTEFALELLRRLIRENSTDDEGGVIAVLEAACTEGSLVSRRVPSVGGHENLLIGLCESDLELAARGACHERLIFNCHMDTSPVGALTTWSVDPFGGDIEGANVFGRGASDAKGGLAAMLTAMRTVKRVRGDASGLTLTAVSQETAGNVGTRDLVGKGLRGAGAIVGEHTMGVSMAVAYRGVIWAQLEISGRSAHPGRPDQAVDAIELMVNEFIPALRRHAWDEAPHPMLPEPHLTVTEIRGGHSMAMIADHAVATIDMRTLPAQSVTSVFATLGEICAAVAAGHPESTVSFRKLYSVDGFESPRDSRVSQLLEMAIHEISGHEATKIGKVGMCDGNVLANHADIPTVIFGPGNPSGMGPDEYCNISALRSATAVLQSVGERWVSGQNAA